MAEPGGVCVSGKVHDEVRGKLDLAFEDLGELRLKNIADPVRAWRVADVAAVPMQRVAGLPIGNPGGDAGEGVVVDLARFRRREPPARPAPDGAPSIIADHNLPQPNPNFIGRADELTTLRHALTATGRSAITQSRQAISGLGGIGKTQLALAFAYAHLGDYDLVRWLRAEAPSVLAADYAGLAPALGLDPGLTDQAALVAAVRARLERAERWLLVFDNAVQPGALDPYLPRTGGGHVLVTSRWQDWEGTAAALELETLPEAEAVSLLLGDGADDPAERAAAAELAQELGRLPLALAQARAFMRARKLGVAGYRQQLAAARPKVLAWRPPDAGYPFAVAQAWQVSLDHAGQDCPAATELLRLLAFLGPDAVPRDLLGANPGALPGALRDPFDRDGAIEALGRYSLLRVAPDSLTVHRLVQAVTRDGLDEAAGARCAAMAVALVDTALPRSGFGKADRPVTSRLLPHALVATEAAERFGAGLAEVGTILTVLGEHLMTGGAGGEAEPLLRRGLAVREQVLGPEHPDVATSLDRLANACGTTGRTPEAEALHRRALAVRERTLGPEHPLVAEGLGCLGLFLLCEKRRAEAEPIVARALAAYERVLGPELPDHAFSLSHVARLHQQIGQIAEAESFFRRALDVAEQSLGPEHPDVATYLERLAGLYLSIRRNAEAEPLLERALAIAERNASPKDSDLAFSLNRVAGIYRAAGRHAEAEPLLRRALDLRERTLGPQHPLVADSLSDLAGPYWITCNFAEAEALLQRALAIQERVLGPEHPAVATSLDCLSEIYDLTRRHTDAAPLQRRALAIRERVLGPEHREVAESLGGLGRLYKALGRYAEAESLLRRALAIRERALGPEHPAVAGSLNDLGGLYKFMGRYAEAEPLHRRAVAVCEQALASEHHLLGFCLGNLGELLQATGRYAEAEPLHRRCLEIVKKALSPQHPQQKRRLDNHAAVLDQLGRHDEAAALRDQAEATRRPPC